jgi:translation initiation factor 2B subunit (eIF-2B alpha/beta/delta family)
VVDHPGYPGYPGDRANTHQADSAAMQRLGRERYATLLSSHPAMLVCGSIFAYLVAKVFEGMAAGCLVIAERASLGERLSALGFIEGEHYVGTDLLHVIEDVARVRDQCLRDDPMVRRMVGTAARKISEQHSTAIRATQIHHICTQ